MTEAESTSSDSMANPTSTGKQSLTGRQLLNSSYLDFDDFRGRRGSKSPLAADFSYLYASMDSIASAASVDFWKSNDLSVLYGSTDSVNLAPIATTAAAEAGDLYSSIDVAVGLLSAIDPSVPQSFMARLMARKDSVFGSKDSIFGSNESLPFTSRDYGISKVAETPDVPATFALPDNYESGEWMNFYELSHKEIQYTQDIFKNSDSNQFMGKGSKWDEVYREALKGSTMTHPVITHMPALEPLPMKSPQKTRKKSPRIRGEPKQKIYVVPTPIDIISGRGGRSNNWPGNERYRAAVEEAKPAYKAGAKYEKTFMSQDIVNKMMEEGRRFLKLDETAGPRRGEYYLMTKNQARKKVAQALREENTPESRKMKREFYSIKRKQNT